MKIKAESDKLKNQRGLDLYFVKGEIIYKFGNYFKAWNDSVQFL